VTNVLIVLSHFMMDSFGLAIIALTIVIRTLMYPLFLKQIKATRAMHALQPKIAELQKKYARNRQRLGQEQMRLYREAGMSPTGCLLPMLVQLPIWIALYQSIMRVLAVIPEDFLGLSHYLYSWPMVYTRLPLNNYFLWLNLAIPDPQLVLPILVGGTMWVQQKMITAEAATAQQQSQNRMMLWAMPLMFAMLTLSFPSGLALYWTTSNIITIVMQYLVGGWGGLASLIARKPAATDKGRARSTTTRETEDDTETSESETALDEGISDEKSRGKRQERRASNPRRPRTARRQPRRSKDQDTKGS
jgi:YidC/Oxa1 family membrane protein insertase